MAISKCVNQNTAILIQENAFENFVCKVLSILSRPQWVLFLQTTARLLNYSWAQPRVTSYGARG